MRVERNAEKDGIEIFFDDKPDQALRDRLKSNGFRFGKFKKCWYAKYTHERWEFAISLSGVSMLSIPNDAPPLFEPDNTDAIADEVDSAIAYLQQLLEEI